MSGLTSLPPRLPRQASSTLAPYAPQRTQEQERSTRSPWRKWYGLKRWKDMRKRVLLNATYTCVICGVLEGDTSKLVADHIRPHRGSAERFWDEGNLQCVCAQCHSSIKQREEQSELIGVWD